MTTDPAAELREAASDMRRQEPGWLGREFWAALAEWLEVEATAAGALTDEFGTAAALGLPDGRALAVARAYLGVDAQ